MFKNYWAILNLFKGIGSRCRGAERKCFPLKFVCHLWTNCAPWHLDLITNIQTKYFLKRYIKVQRCKIMNEFRRFLGRISTETCLKNDYFGNVNLKNHQALAAPHLDPFPPAARGFVPRLPFRLND